MVKYLLILIFSTGCSNVDSENKKLSFSRSLLLHEGGERHYMWTISLDKYRSDEIPVDINSALISLDSMIHSDIKISLNQSVSVHGCNSNDSSKNSYAVIWQKLLNDLSVRYPIQKIKKEVGSKETNQLINSDLESYFYLLSNWFINNWNLNDNNSLNQSLDSLGLMEPHEKFYYLLFKLSGCENQDLLSLREFVYEEN